MSKQFVTIAQFRDFPAAGHAQSLLEEAGIPCFLDNQYMVGVNWLYSNAVGGVKLKVLERDVEQARNLLQDFSTIAAPQDQPDEAHLEPSTCPKCGSSEIITRNYQRKFAALSLLLSLPLFIFLKRHRCKKCGYRWK